MKIIKQISDTVFEVELEEYDNSDVFEFSIQHDYIGFKGNNHLSTKNGTILRNNTNYISFQNYVQIPIRTFSQVIMDQLKEHSFLQPEHLITKDNEPKYSYYNKIVRYYDACRKCYMIAICLKGESEFNCVTEQFYNRFIKPNL